MKVEFVTVGTYRKFSEKCLMKNTLQNSSKFIHWNSERIQHIVDATSRLRKIRCQKEKNVKFKMRLVFQHQYKKLDIVETVQSSIPEYCTTNVLQIAKHAEKVYNRMNRLWYPPLAKPR